MIDYYDAVLLTIPVMFVAATAAILATGTELTAAVPTASLPVLLVIGHAMFVRAPTDTPARTPTAPGRPGDATAD